MSIYIGLAFLLLYVVCLQRLVMAASNGLVEDYSYKSKGLLIASFCLLVVLAAGRGQSVGTDTAMYKRFFHTRQYEAFEPAVYGLYELAYRSHFYELVPIMLSVLFLYGMLRGIYKHCPNDAVGLLLFVLTFVYFTSFNQMRQLVAAALIFGFTGLLAKPGFRKWSFLLVIGAAALFHQSAIFLVWLLLLPQRRIHLGIVASLFIAATICYFTPAVKDAAGEMIQATSSFYEDKYMDEYIDFFDVNKEKGLVEFLPIAVQMLIVLASYYVRQGAPFFVLVTNLYIVHLTLYAFSGIEAIDRVQVYTGMMAIYFYAQLIHQLARLENQLVGRLLAAALVVFWFSYYAVRLLNNHQGIVPYIW